MNTLPALLHAFFYDGLIRQQGLSPNTIKSYRDGWRLFLRFVSHRRRRPIPRLDLADLTVEEVLTFLDDAEQTRRATVGTRNCRLAAIRAFFAFVAQREPLAVAQATGILNIPTKRAPRRAISYLDVTEVAAILAQPDRRSATGQRDHALLALLYNTGGRIQEVLDLTPSALRLESPAAVHLLGKGRKERVCPLWPETVTILKALMRRQSTEHDARLFVNQRGFPLTASGVRYKLAAYVAAAARTTPTLSKKRVSPHTFRHTAAVHLVAAGVDVTIIRSWLGHADLDTTSLYAQANLDTKRRALEQVYRPGKDVRPPPWRRPSVMAWLDSL